MAAAYAEADVTIHSRSLIVGLQLPNSYSSHYLAPKRIFGTALVSDLRYCIWLTDPA